MTSTVVPLGDIAEFVRGITFSPDDVAPVGTPGTAACLRTKNVQAELDVSDLWAVPKAFVKRPDQLVRSGDILVSSANSWNLVGKCCWIPELPWETTFGGFVSVLRPNSKKVEPRFLYRWFASDRIQALLRSFGNQTTSISNLSLDRCRRLELPLPPLAEQRRIAAILDKADLLRARRRAAMRTLSGFAESLFSDLERSSESAGWATVSLPDAFWFQEGPGVRTSQFRPTGVKLLNVGNIEVGGTLNLAKTSRFISQQEFETKYRHFSVDDGDFVIASSGISFDADGFLRTRGAFVRADDLPLCMNTSTIRFKAVKGTSSLRFLSGWISSLAFRSQITRLVTGSAQQNFGPSHLAQVRIALPPLGVQEFLGRKLDAVDGVGETQRTSLSGMNALFAALQRRAFAGTL